MGDRKELSLFDELRAPEPPPEPKTEYRLYDESRMRFVPGMIGELTRSEAQSRNEYFEKSKCGHLKWQTAAERPVRTYTIKR